MGKLGHLEIVCGSMYCGKTEELIRRLKRDQFANKQFQLFKPIIDNRYGNDVETHYGLKLEAIMVCTSEDILEHLHEDTKVVGIDEIQFFQGDIIEVIDKLIMKGIKIIASGLDMYSSGEPFGNMPILMAKAKYVDKLHAVCVDCGDDAMYSFNLGDLNTHSQVKVGSVGEYIAVCQTCREDRLKRMVH